MFNVLVVYVVSVLFVDYVVDIGYADFWESRDPSTFILSDRITSVDDSCSILLLLALFLLLLYFLMHLDPFVW